MPARRPSPASWSPIPSDCPLTAAQLRALTVYVEAGTVKLAAHRLGRSPNTVNGHLQRARARTGMSVEQMVYAGTLAGWFRVRG